jgi:deoxyribodipyrimidine photolyase
MNNIVLKYLNKNYRFTLKTYDNFLVKEIISDNDVKLSEVISLTKLIFMISEEESLKIFDDWADQQLTFINNRVVELQERLHKNGYSVQNLTLEDYEDCS